MNLVTCGILGSTWLYSDLTILKKNNWISQCDCSDVDALRQRPWSTVLAVVSVSVYRRLHFVGAKLSMEGLHVGKTGNKHSWYHTISIYLYIYIYLYLSKYIHTVYPYVYIHVYIYIYIYIVFFFSCSSEIYVYKWWSVAEVTSRQRWHSWIEKRELVCGVWEFMYADNQHVSWFTYIYSITVIQISFAISFASRSDLVRFHPLLLLFFLV